MIGVARILLWNWILTGSKRKMISSGRFLQEATVTAAPQGLPSIRDAQFLVREASCSSLDASLEGELVHLSCPVIYPAGLGDEDPLLQSTPADQRMGLKLEAFMEVFQWEEFPYTKKVGKRNVRDHLYFREWLPTSPPRNSSFFGGGSRCEVNNGGRPCLQWKPDEEEPWWNMSGYDLGLSTVDLAQNITFGDGYELPLSDDLIDKMAALAGSPQRLQPACINSNNENNNDGPCNTAAFREERYYIAWQQTDSNGENIDYLTRYYSLYTMDSVSVLAVQQGNSFVPFETLEGKSLFEFVPGSRSAAQMIEDATSSAVVAAPDGRIGALIAFVGLFFMVVMG